MNAHRRLSRGLAILAAVTATAAVAAAEPTSVGGDHLYGWLAQGDVDDTWEADPGRGCTDEYRSGIAVTARIEDYAPDDVVRFEIDFAGTLDDRTVDLTATAPETTVYGDATDGCLPYVRLTGVSVASVVEYYVDEGEPRAPTCLPLGLPLPCIAVPLAP